MFGNRISACASAEDDILSLGDNKGTEIIRFRSHGPFFDFKVSQGTTLKAVKLISLLRQLPVPSAQLNDIAIDHQAVSMMKFILDIFSQQKNSSYAIPSMQTLLQCVSGGWKPSNLSSSFLDSLLDQLNIEPPSSALRDIGIQLLSLLIEHSPKVCDDVMQAIKRNRSSPTRPCYKLDDHEFALLSLIAQYYFSECYELDLLQSNGSIGVIPTSRDESSSAFGWASLGDSVEIRINDRWIAGIVVKTDSVRDEMTVQVEVYRDRPELVVVARDSSLLRTPKAMQLMRHSSKSMLPELSSATRQCARAVALSTSFEFKLSEFNKKIIYLFLDDEDASAAHGASGLVSWSDLNEVSDLMVPLVCAMLEAHRLQLGCYLPLGGGGWKESQQTSLNFAVNHFLDTAKQLLRNRLTSVHPPVCMKCGQEVHAQISGTWELGWSCDCAHHSGRNVFGDENVLYGCATISDCDWGMCETCYHDACGADVVWAVHPADLKAVDAAEADPAAVALNETNASDLSEAIMTDPLEVLANAVVQSMFRYIVICLSEEFNILQSSSSAVGDDDSVDCAMQIINLFANSSDRRLLVDFVYGPIITRCGITVRLFVEKTLRSESIHLFAAGGSEYYESLKQLEVVERACGNVLQRCCPSSVNVAALLKVVHDVVRRLGYLALTDAVVDRCWRDIALDRKVQCNMLQLMQNAVLLCTNPFAQPSKDFRRLLSKLCQHGSPRALAIIETMWRESVALWLQTTCLNHSYIGKLSENSQQLVERLSDMLGRATAASNLDMSVLRKCAASSFFAFNLAFRRIPDSLSADVSKQLAVRVAALLDSTRNQTRPSQWESSLEATLSLIQVFHQHSSDAFEHFHEILLARRLLSARYVSLEMERRVLLAIPSSSKSWQMIRDMEHMEETMMRFKSYLLNRIDVGEVARDSGLSNFLFNRDHLKVHVLSGMCWPSYLVSPIVYANLQTPSLMRVIECEFHRFFALQDTQRAISILNMSPKPVSIVVEDCVENKRLNGVYSPTIETMNGWPVLISEESSNGKKYILEYSSLMSWQIKPSTEKGSNKCLAYISVTASQRFPECLYTSQWNVLQPGGRFALSRMKVKAVEASSSSHSSRQGYNDSSQGRSMSRRLHWCHGAGTVTLQLNIFASAPRYFQASEAQASLLMAFNESSLVENRIRLTVPQLTNQLSLSEDEVCGLLASLLDPEFPVLQSESGQIFLSHSLLRGDFGGRAIGDPLLLSSLQVKNMYLEHSAYSNETLHSWRRELIDACIVRTLKSAFRERSGLFRSSKGFGSAAMPQDLLADAVKVSLSRKCALSDEEILRRCEKLVSSGIIEKVAGNSDTFRSVAYCYLDDADPALRTSVVVGSKQLDSRLGGVESIRGEELLGHVRIVLKINSLPNGAPGVPRALFIRKFISWMLTTKLGVDLKPHQLLSHIGLICARVLGSVCSQLYALEYQHWAGLSSDEDYLDKPILRTIVGVAELEECVKIGETMESFNFSLETALHLPEDSFLLLMRVFQSVVGLSADTEIGSISTENYSQVVDEAKRLWSTSMEVVNSQVLPQEIASRLLEVLDSLACDDEEEESSKPSPLRPLSRTQGVLVPKAKFLTSGAFEDLRITLKTFCDVLFSIGFSRAAHSLNKSSSLGDALAAYLTEANNIILGLFDKRGEYWKSVSKYCEDEEDSFPEDGDDKLLSHDHDRVLLPCEFCPDLFPAADLEAHMLVCRIASPRIPVPISPLIASIFPLTSSAADSRVATQPEAVRFSPSSFSTIVAAFGSSILEGIVEWAQSKFELSEDESDSVDVTLSSALSRTFKRIDMNKDGYWTPSDFSKPLQLGETSRGVDPKLVYSDEPCHSISGDMFKFKASVSVDDYHEIPFQSVSKFDRVDSLWAVVSSGMSIPSQKSSRSFSSLHEARQEMLELVLRTRQIINELEGTSLTLLIRYKWDLHSLVDEFLDNPQAVRLTLGLGPRHLPSFLRFDFFGPDAARQNPSTTVTCDICCEACIPKNMFSLSCMHWFCRSCWSSYLSHQISDRNLAICCPQAKCEMLVSPEMPPYFCTQNILEFARESLVKSFIEERQSGGHVGAAYCKNARGCSGVVLMNDGFSSSEASCSVCGSNFCVSCEFPPHLPATCEIMAKWDEKGGYIDTGRSEDVEVRRLKHMTTKPCPKCGVRIEKNQGCPHMSCRCKHQFCWDCGGDYHTSDRCIRPKVVPETGSILHFEELDKHCANHFLARRLALANRAECLDSLEQIQLSGLASKLRVKVQGWEVIAEAQSALAHSCIVSYYIRSTKFEFQFGELKHSAQILHHKFEEVWTRLELFPEAEAKASIRVLRMRLREFLLSAQAELVQTVEPQPSTTHISSAVPIYRQSSERVSDSPQVGSHFTPRVEFGNAFGGFVRSRSLSQQRK